MKSDIVIIGAGIIGCALAYELAKYDLNITVLEKTSYVASGATKANSAMLHEGLSTKPNTLREKFVHNSREELDKVMKVLNLDYKKGIGLITLAFSQDEIEVLKSQVDQAHSVGLHGEILSREEILEMEPHVNPNIVGGFYSKSVSVLGPYELCIAMAENAALNNVKFVFNSEVIGIEKDNNKVSGVITKDNRFEAKLVINAAGINSDKVLKMVEESDFYVRPRKGEYFLYDKEYGNLVSHVISVLGNSESKGMIVLPTMHGNLLAGSSAEMIENKEDLSTTQSTLDKIYSNAIQKICPELKRNEGVITTFSGLRSVSNTEDFVIQKAKTVNNFIYLLGIQSPGLSSCINIAKYVIDLCKESNAIAEWYPREKYIVGLPKKKRISELELEEANKLIRQNPDYGEIVCRCELITKGEIIDAIHSVVPATTVDAIKRKLRCGMGRCQGGFCLQRIIKIIHEEMNKDLLLVSKDLEGSEFVVAHNRN